MAVRRPRGHKAALRIVQRFGLGPKPGLVARIAADPLAALDRETRRPGQVLIHDPSLPDYAGAARLSTEFSTAEALFRTEMEARVDKHMAAEIGFAERLVIFWSNHFSMSVRKNEAVLGLVGQLERDVIRRHVFGNFTDMLLGVMMHPAILAFLDNADSIGPNSQKALWWKGRGNNENLAREVLELYTVGSGAGYTETDVAALAKILTGWSYVRRWEADNGWDGGSDANRGQFIFRPEWHEPGPIAFMGRTYQDTGIDQGIQVLRRLARSPLTAENIAFKLIRHFITDRPRPRDVKRLAGVFIKTRGNLKSVARALIRLPGALTLPPAKIRPPYENAVAQFRAMGQRWGNGNHGTFWGAMHFLNQQPFECPSPEGWSDETADWLGADAMTLRLDTALAFAWSFGRELPARPPDLARQLFGRALSANTQTAVAAAYDDYRALATLFVSPEFQRR